MTICIAAIGKFNSKDCIVFATDHMISQPNLGEFEHAIQKYRKLNSDNIAMLSGDPLLFEEILKNSDLDVFEEISKQIFKNIITIKQEKINSQIHCIFNTDDNYIKNVALLQKPENNFINQLLGLISNFKLKTSILLIGFNEGKAKICEVTEFGIVQLRDLNFGAIGSGSLQASNTFLFQKHSKEDDLITTIYNVYKAKRNAEVARGVGKETEVAILTEKKGIRELDRDHLEILNTIYEEELKWGKKHKDLNKANPYTGDGK